MILIDNINYLRDKYPLIREKLREIEDSQEKDFQIEETRRGDQTLSYSKDDRKVYFHSKYNPIREAETIVEEYKDLEDKNIIFYGTGLGYHIDLIIKENPDNNFYIFEPMGEILEKFLSVRNLSLGQYKNLKGLNLGLEDMEEEIGRFLDINRKDTVIIELPIHKQFFPDQFKEFADTFLNVTRSRRSSLATNYAFQKRWIVNSMKNFKEVLTTPNILMGSKDKFKDKPALLVAAGPSLNEEIENIRHIKDNGLAYIFSVGSAINTLIHHNIYPHAATTYDPSERNQIVFEKLKEREIKDIPMIFGSSVGYETLDNYPGDKYHMITSQDKIASYYLANDESEIDIVLDAPSIAVVTLQLLSNLGFSPIILAGQNLGYTGTAKHSEGVQYSRDLNEAELENALWTEDVYGEQIRTTQGFNSMRSQLELYIDNMEEGKVVNTTKGGAKIKGTNFRELKDIMEKDLKSSLVKQDWLEGNRTNYGKENLENKLNSMDRALEESYRWIREYRSNLFKLYDLVRNRNFNQLDTMYGKLDVSIEALESNPFFTTFILPINRVEHKLLADAVKIFKIEKDIYKKHIDLLNAYRVFIDKCYKDMEEIKTIYEEMRQGILGYIGEGKEAEDHV